MNKIKSTFNLIAIILIPVTFIACSPDPEKENIPELITKVTLTFTATGEAPIVVTATDPDGEGVQNLVVDGEIELKANTEYLLELELINGLATPGSDAYDITAEVEAEGDEHQFYFEWTAGLFSTPEGNGNLDNGADPVDYSGAANSLDENGLPLGITTSWFTAGSGTGTFRTVLKHQPGLKVESGSSTLGETDLDVSFSISIN